MDLSGRGSWGNYQPWHNKIANLKTSEGTRQGQSRDIKALKLCGEDLVKYMSFRNQTKLNDKILNDYKVAHGFLQANTSRDLPGLNLIEKILDKNDQKLPAKKDKKE